MSTQYVRVLPQYRILVIGDPGVGKTSLIDRYVHNQFPTSEHSHVNQDGSTVWKTTINGQNCSLMFLKMNTTDNLSLVKIYSGIPTACFIMFSVCDHRSFERVDHIQNSLDFVFSNDSQSIRCIVLANKVDLEDDRSVTQRAITRFHSTGYDLIEISVKTGIGIHEALNRLVKYMQDTDIQNINIPKSGRMSSFSCVVL